MILGYCPFLPPFLFPPRGKGAESSKYCFSLCVLCEALCDPLCLNDLELNTKGTKVSTKEHKGLFQQPLGKGVVG
jgi:hypothetical protein